MLQFSQGGGTYRSKKYREAMTKEQQCKVPRDGLNWHQLAPWWFKEKMTQDGLASWFTEKMSKEYNEYCLKSKSNNIIICPKKFVQPSNTLFNHPINEIQGVNDYFKNLGKKSKKTKKKGKDRRNKKNKKSKKKKSTKKKSKKKKKEKSTKKKTKKSKQKKSKQKKSN